MVAGKDLLPVFIVVRPIGVSFTKTLNMADVGEVPSHRFALNVKCCPLVYIVINHKIINIVIEASNLKSHKIKIY